MIPKSPYETFTIDTKKLLNNYSFALEFIDENLGSEISPLIEESLEQPHAFPTLEFWNRKLNEFFKPKSVINDFLFVKLLEIGAFYQGYKKGTMDKEEKENIVAFPRISSYNINKQDFFSENQVTTNFDSTFCFVIPVHIRNTKALRFFQRMLSSVLDQIVPPSQIIVIDDGSPIEIDSSKFIHDKIFIHRSNKQRGPAYSRNLGAEIACEEQYDIIVFSDYDIVLPNNWTKILIDVLEQQKGDLISGINYSYGNTWWDWYHNVNGTLNGRAYRHSQNLLYATTAALAVKSSVFEKIQFNEHFQDAAGEDIDFCLRAIQNNFQIYLARDLRTKHDYGYTGILFDDLKLFFSRFSRYGSAEPLLSFLHPNYHSKFYNSIGLSIYQSFVQSAIPDFPFVEVNHSSSQ